MRTIKQHLQSTQQQWQHCEQYAGCSMHLGCKYRRMERSLPKHDIEEVAPLNSLQVHHSPVAGFDVRQSQAHEH